MASPARAECALFAALWLALSPGAATAQPTRATPRGRSAGEAPRPISPPPTAAPAAAALAPTTTATPPPAKDSLRELLRRADALAREVSRMRRLPLRAAIAKDLVDEPELRRRFDALTEEDLERQAMTREAAWLKHWGLIPADVDYRTLMVDALSEAVAGYYDADRKRLTLNRTIAVDPESDWPEMVLVHELTHALQDQNFDLTKFHDLPLGEDDAEAARTALAEGDGMAVMLSVMARRDGEEIAWSNPEEVQDLLTSITDDADPEFAALPLVVREGLSFPYEAGLRFVAALRRHGAWSAVDRAFRRPPASTEQILHPDLYLSHHAPIPVAKLAAPTSLPNSDVSNDTVWGELGFSVFLRTHGVAAVRAAAAAAGWGGDRVTLIASQAGEIGVARMVWDSQHDAEEAYGATVEALDRWLEAAVIEQTATRTVWIDSGLRLSVIEVKDRALLMVHQVPMRAARELYAELWPQLWPGLWRGTAVPPSRRSGSR
jgi:hypothetical protein